jgi:triacylglycerol lipase
MLQAKSIRGRQSAMVSIAHRRRDVRLRAGAIRAARTAVRTISRAATVQAYELAMMAAVAATLPLHLVNGSDPGRGPLPAARAHTAANARPVLLVHGFGGGKSSWSVIARTLSARGLTVDAITYPPFGTSVENVAERLVVEVERTLSQTGAEQVHLVGHSLGGVVIAQAIAGGRLTGLVDTVVTLGSPFGGSPWARLLPFGAIVPALRENSPLLRRLASAPIPDDVRWVAFSAALDMIVPGVRSIPAQARVETITVSGVGHLGMLLNRQVVGRIAAALPA